MNKNWLSYVSFVVSDHCRQCYSIGFGCIMFNFGVFLTFWWNLEIQDGGSRMPAVWKLWRNSYVRRRLSSCCWLERNTFRCSIYPPSLIVIDLILPELFKEGSRIRRINKMKISDRHMEDFILHRVYVRSSYCFHYGSFEVKKTSLKCLWSKKFFVTVW